MKPQRIAIIGTGLIGASIGLALRRRGKQKLHITGWDRVRANALAARRRGALTSVAPSFNSAVAQADVVVIATPLPAVERLIPRALARARPHALVLDVSPIQRRPAAKGHAALQRMLRKARLAAHHNAPRAMPSFVAGHPLAGSERSGAAAARADLFEARPFAMYAPPQPHAARARRAAAAFVRALGAVPVILDPATHDRRIAATSALPQLASIAVALAAQRTLGSARRAGRAGTTPSLVGPGFRSVTRLAQSPFSIWDTALFWNRANVQRSLRELARQVAALAAALERGDRGKMSLLFRDAASAARRILGPKRRSHADR